jgi:hypothetical protein
MYWESPATDDLQKVDASRSTATANRNEGGGPCLSDVESLEFRNKKTDPINFRSDPYGTGPVRMNVTGNNRT